MVLEFIHNLNEKHKGLVVPRFQLGSFGIPVYVVRCYKLIGVFLFGAAVEQTTTNILKYSVGEKIVISTIVLYNILKYSVGKKIVISTIVLYNILKYSVDKKKVTCIIVLYNILKCSVDKKKVTCVIYRPGHYMCGILAQMSCVMTQVKTQFTAMALQEHNLLYKK